MGEDTTKLEEFPVAESVSKKKKILKILKKIGPVLIVILCVVLIAGFLLARRANTERAWDRASDYFSRGDYEKASKELDGLSVPSDEKKLLVYSQTNLAKRQLDDALEGYTKLYEIKKDPSYKLIIGNIYNEQKKYEEAAKIYRESIASNPNFVQAYVNLATLYKMQGDIQKAVETAELAVKNNPSNVTLHELKVSMLLDDKESEKFKEAVEDLNRLNPNDPLLKSLDQ